MGKSAANKHGKGAGYGGQWALPQKNHAKLPGKGGHGFNLPKSPAQIAAKQAVEAENAVELEAKKAGLPKGNKKLPSWANSGFMGYGPTSTYPLKRNAAFLVHTLDQLPSEKRLAALDFVRDYYAMVQSKAVPYTLGHGPTRDQLALNDPLHVPKVMQTNLHHHALEVSLMSAALTQMHGEGGSWLLCTIPAELLKNLLLSTEAVYHNRIQDLIADAEQYENYRVLLDSMLEHGPGKYVADYAELVLAGRMLGLKVESYWYNATFLRVKL